MVFECNEKGRTRSRDENERTRRTPLTYKCTGWGGDTKHLYIYIYRSITRPFKLSDAHQVKSNIFCADFDINLLSVRIRTKGILLSGALLWAFLWALGPLLGFPWALVGPCGRPGPSGGRAGIGPCRGPYKYVKIIIFNV